MADEESNVEKYLRLKAEIEDMIENFDGKAVALLG